MKLGICLPHYGRPIGVERLLWVETIDLRAEAVRPRVTPSHE